MSTYTEEDAKEKWCPAARVSFRHPRVEGIYPAEEGYIGNRDANDGTVPSSHCLGSTCMWWRWADCYDHEHLVQCVREYTDKGETVAAIQFYRAHAPSLSTGEKRDIREAKAFVDAVASGNNPRLIKRKGYCGMAGRPE